MFKSILVPTDGSALSIKAAASAVQFAKSIGAPIEVLSVAEPYPYSPIAETAFTPDLSIYEQKMQEIAGRNVEQVDAMAREAGVPCKTHIVQSFNPYEEIVKLAEQAGCDLIFMASHGRKGLNRIFLGSETQKVLAHSKIPVLVFR